MKKHIFLLMAFLTMGLVFTACNKNNDETLPVEEDLTTEEDILMLQDAVEDTEDEVDLYITTRGEESGQSDCPVITVIPDGGAFPKTITLDYGDGCEGPAGRLRQGKIVVMLTAPLHEANASRTVTFEDFFLDGAQIHGTKILRNEGFDENGNVKFTREVSISLTYPDGKVASWTASHTLRQIAGGNTVARFDDIFALAGQSSGINRNGVEYSSVILEPLIKSKTCRWIQKGIREVTVTRENESRTRTIDFGSGLCDPAATVTLANGETIRVLIKPWWRVG